ASERTRPRRDHPGLSFPARGHHGRLDPVLSRFHPRLVRRAVLAHRRCASRPRIAQTRSRRSACRVRSHAGGRAHRQGFRKRHTCLGRRARARREPDRDAAPVGDTAHAARRRTDRGGRWSPGALQLPRRRVALSRRSSREPHAIFSADPRLQHPPAVYRGHCGHRAPARPVPRPSDRIAPRRRSDPRLRAPTLRARRCPLALHGLPSRQVTRLLIAGSPHARSAAPYAVGVVAFAYFLAFPLQPSQSDESVYLYGSQRLLEGQVLYRDFFEFITPGALYFFAGEFALPGPSLLAARVGMAAVNGLAAWLLFSLVRRVAGVAEALGSALIFVVVCLSVWRQASPHWLTT